MDNLKYEKELYKKGVSLIAGVDEVGRGPLIGPVVACAVILPKNYQLEGLTDSKKLTEKKREEYYSIIMEQALSVGIGIVDASEIDRINILEATKVAMIKAVEDLNIQPEHVLVDAMNLEIPNPNTSIIKGDLKSISIAAASVIAKVTRDRMMVELDKKHPEYGFAKHKGYPTKQHVENVTKYGVLKEYRFTFKPIRDLIRNGDIFDKNS